ncbi:glycosyltransferase [Sphingobium sufflavum]|uniref:glycosyltransferase n=1 Tax=Sphingobium sufflavum TaxID=1129547 RepID=UPI0022777072
MATVKLSVVIPHYNDLAALDICLKALAVQTLPADQFEIIVSDNNSAVGPDAVAAAIAGRARMVVQMVPGAGPARNAGVEASTGEILAFIDSDCVAEPQWLEEGLAGLSDYDFVGGKVNVLVEPGRVLTGSEAFEAVFAFDNESYVKRKGFTGSGNLFCPRAIFDKVGGFAAGVSEDMDWSHRASALGYRLGYRADAAIGHPARGSWSALVRKWRRLNRETYGLLRQRPLGRLRWIGRTWLLPVSVIVHLPKIWKSPALSTLSERVAASVCLVKIRFWRLLDAHQLALGLSK